MNNITICKVCKYFEEVKSIDNISIEIMENKIYGLIGRNGAGKTTLLKLLANQLRTSEGEIKISGEILENNDELMQKICLARDTIKNYFGVINYKIKDILKQASYMYPYWDNEYANELIERFDLDIYKKYNKLSKGMQTSVGIIIGLASRAPITLFDEPYSGLDPVARELFYELLLEDYDENPRTIIISSHLVGEFENIFEHVLILEKGKLKLETSMEELSSKAYIVEGEYQTTFEALKNKNIINRNILGRMVTYTIYDFLSEDEKKHMRELGINVKNIGLQKLFVNLSKGGKENDN
ncbi:ABC transporter ATP-binding protein [Clostridiaceae bacterium M8S5]|nr:ABC transporter ATP-binding protein [Clostridiaceae bacterium M8S5]